MIERLTACDAVPGGTRGALKLACRDLTRAWTRGSYDLQTLELPCRAMIDGLRQAVAARCGW